MNNIFYYYAIFYVLEIIHWAYLYVFSKQAKEYDKEIEYMKDIDLSNKEDVMKNTPRIFESSQKMLQREEESGRNGILFWIIPFLTIIWIVVGIRSTEEIMLFVALAILHLIPIISGIIIYFYFKNLINGLQRRIMAFTLIQKSLMIITACAIMYHHFTH